ncbi:hypothetical protein [Wolbachia endosymbiont (group A) of Cydia strobilella]|uniref:hypothetical protein n=1 Tax=Wolbachia endosymbiont (group A) of Cydia strobilella TaxID=3066170 RepID=UPI003132998B
MRYLLSEERCNKAIPVSSTGMTPSWMENWIPVSSAGMTSSLSSLLLLLSQCVTLGSHFTL